MKQRRKLGLALGGGAARGLAHLGVLKALDEAGIRADYISGTSAGSIVGSLYAGGYSWEAIADAQRALDWADFVKPVFPKMGLVRATRLEERLDEMLGDRTMEDLDIPFRAVSVDLVSSRQHVIDSGSVARAVRASCSIPGIFEPVIDGDRVLVDGGVLNDVPADVAFDMGADYVIAVDLNHDMVEGRSPENIFNVIMYSFVVMARGCRTNHLANPKKNLRIIAPDLHDFNYYNLKRIDELMQRGEDATRQILPELLRTLKRRRIFG